MSLPPPLGAGASLPWGPCARLLGPAPVRVSYALAFCCAVELTSAVQVSLQVGAWPLLLACGQVGVLLLTVLAHELGHARMARRLGREVDRLVLLPLGGTCSSVRMRLPGSSASVWREEMWVALSGQAVHLLLGPLCAGGLLLIEWQAFGRCSGGRCTACSSVGCVLEYANPMRPEPALFEVDGRIAMGELLAVFWRTLGLGVRVNALLFVVNAAVPMYPSDCARVLAIGLVHCCGLSTDTVAVVVSCANFISAGVLLVASVWTVPAFDGVRGGALVMMLAMHLALTAVLGFSDAWDLHDLRVDGQLATHPLFAAARPTAVGLGKGRPSALLPCDAAEYHCASDTERDARRAQGAAPLLQRCLCRLLCAMARRHSKHIDADVELGFLGSPPWRAACAAP